MEQNAYNKKEKDAEFESFYFRIENVLFSTCLRLCLEIRRKGQELKQTQTMLMLPWRKALLSKILLFTIYNCLFMAAKIDHQVVCFGETLWNISPTGRQAGGAPLHLAYHLQMLGINPAIISRIGYDTAGKQLIEALEAKGICTDYFQMDEHKPTGVVTTSLRDGCEVVYSIHHDVAWDGIEYMEELAELTSKANFFVFGSLATRCKKTHQTLLTLLSFANTKVLNINLRAPFYSRSKIEDLLLKADILKLSEAELELITGWFSNYRNDTDRIRLLQERFAVPDIIVDKEKMGSIWVSGNTIYEHSGFVKTTSETGESGDAFLAALLAKLHEGSTPDKALEFATAICALMASYGEPYPVYKPSQIDALLNIKNE